MKYLAILFVLFVVSDEPRKPYAWLETTPVNGSIVSRIQTPAGYTRADADKNSFAYWLRNLPLKPIGTPVERWNGELKPDQTFHEAVVDLDFIGKDLQQCIDVIIRLRAEYLWSSGKEDEIGFSNSCCAEKITWKKWKDGWRTKIVKKNGKDVFEWVKTKTFDNSRKNFHDYLYHIMLYAGTLSLSRDMKTISAPEVNIGDAYIQGGAPGLGHGVIIVDMAVSASGKKIVLLGQSYNPTENFNILKSGTKLSPWFEADFGTYLNTPQWSFTKEHVRRF